MSIDTFPQLPNSIICPVMLAAEGDFSWPLNWPLQREGKWRQIVTSRTLSPRVLTQFHLSGHTIEIQRTYLLAKIYNSDFSAAALCSRRFYPHLRFQSSFFPFNTSHLSSLIFHRHHHSASCWPVPISLHPKVSSQILSVFRYVDFHYPQKPVTRFSVCTPLPTACVIPYFVQTWRYIQLFIISAPSTYFIHSDYGLDSSGIESRRE
jgi:hypothetical protein